MTRIMSLRERADIAEQMVPLALRLAWLVHEQASSAVRRTLACVPDDKKDALIVVLAAAVDVDINPVGLLGWTAVDTDTAETDVREAVRGWSNESIRACHAAYQRGETDPWVIAGNREYGRRRAAAHRRKGAS